MSTTYDGGRRGAVRGRSGPYAEGCAGRRKDMRAHRHHTHTIPVPPNGGGGFTVTMHAAARESSVCAAGIISDAFLYIYIYELSVPKKRKLSLPTAIPVDSRLVNVHNFEDVPSE